MANVVEVPAQQVRSRTRLPWPILTVAAILLLAGVAVAVVARGHETTYSSSTPVSAVQRYLNLLQNGKTDQAYAMTTLDISQSEYDNEMQGWSGTSHTVSLVSSHPHGNTASVTVDISTFSNPPPVTGDNTTRVTFTLSRVSHRWVITGPDYIPSS
jgi:hypothetical protein